MASCSVSMPLENLHLDNYVAAIDFGTSCCSLAFSVKGGGVENLALSENLERVPTAILIKKNENGSVSVASIGFIAQGMYKTLPPAQLAKRIYFECFKMQLRDERNVSRGMLISAHEGESYYLIEVIALMLSYLKIKFEEYLATAGHKIASSKGYRALKSSDFFWVITVPAIWQDRGKQMMREAAYRAGLLSDDISLITHFTPTTQKLQVVDLSSHAFKLTLALEPECAALYCQLLTNEMVARYCETFGDVISNCYMVLDIGGGTVDVAIHKVNEEDNTVDSVLPPTGNDGGGTKVNEEFSKLLQRIVGDPQFKNFRKKYGPQSDAIISTLTYHDFEFNKKHFGADFETEDDLSITLHHKFVGYYTTEAINDGVEALNDDRVELDEDTLIIHFSKLKELFEPAVKSIIDCTSSALDRSPVAINKIYLVGGFGGCKYIYKTLSNFLQKRGCKVDVIVPKLNELAVSRGAVILKQRPEIVKSRCSNAYYGIAQCEKFDPKKHNIAYKKCNAEMGCDYCHDLFCVFIKKDEVVRSNSCFKHSFLPYNHSQSKARIAVYRTTKENVKYVTDRRGNPADGVTLIGTITLNTPPGSFKYEQRNIDITIYLGGTELKVSAYYTPTKQQVHATLDFLSK